MGMSKERVVAETIRDGLEDALTAQRWQVQLCPTPTPRGYWQTTERLRIAIEDGSEFEVQVKRVK